jgi:hypothetical protein
MVCMGIQAWAYKHGQPDLVNDFEDLQQLLLAVLRQPCLRVLQAEHQNSEAASGGRATKHDGTVVHEMGSYKVAVLCGDAQISHLPVQHALSPGTSCQ